MSAGIYNFTIEQGADFYTTFVWQDSNNNPINLTGGTARMQLRDQHKKLVFDASSYLTLTPVQGTVVLSIPGSITTALDFDTLKYDMKVSGPFTTRLVQGVVTLSEEQTV